MKTQQLPALEIKNLSYTYVTEWTRQRRPALKEITLSVLAGESFGFLGHNGAGKTTAIKCLLDLIRPQSGELHIFGKPQRDPRARAAVGYLPEQPYFYDHLTVLETLQMYATLAGVERKARRQKIEETLAAVKLSERSSSPVRALSKGLTQRLALAQAIVADPKLLILDEPFSGLDPLGRKDFRELLSSFKQRGCTIFLSSHILSDVEFLCDRVSIMAQGELKGIFDLRSCPELSSGAYELVLHSDQTLTAQLREDADSTQEENRFLRLTFKDRATAEKALRLALNQHARIESFEFVHSSLEELFMKLVRFDEQRGV